MCGLIGAFRADDAHLQKLDHFMWQGLYMSALRGMGGTGIGLVHREYDMDFAKSHVSAPNFICSAEWEWAAKTMLNSRAVLGHTRSATLGAVKTKNSHPFSFENDKGDGVIMIHNGTIKNWAELTPNTFHHEVDSAHVAYSLFTRGGLETLKMLEGAYTLIWYDRKTKSLNLARNEERELFYTQNKEKTTFWFASELDMLSSVLNRNGIPHEHKGFYELPKFTLVSYDLTKKVLEPILTEYEEKKYQPVFPSGNGGHYETSKEQARNFTKDWPMAGDGIWANVKSDPELALTLYKSIGDGENQVLEKHAYGFILGTRSMDYGSIVRINGVSYQEWNDSLKYLASCVPCKITRIERGVKNAGDNGTHTFYEVILDRDEVEAEIGRMKVSIKLKKTKEQASKVAEAAGRNLPPSKADKTNEPLGVGADGVKGSERNGATVGPGDGGSTGGVAGRVITPMGISEVPPPFGKVPGPRGTKISIEKWREIAEDGCYFCNGSIIEGVDLGNVEWWEHPRNVEDRDPLDAEYQMVCPCCKADPKHIEALVG